MIFRPPSFIYLILPTININLTKLSTLFISFLIELQINFIILQKSSLQYGIKSKQSIKKHMSAEKGLKEELSGNTKQCIVCMCKYDKLYQLSNCQHFFCESCSVSYISSQANNFSTTKCLQQGCNQPLDQNKQIFTKLPPQTVNKIKKHDLFLFLQKNPHFKQCSDQNCLGYFSKNQLTEIKCNKCLKLHCNKCYKLKHEGVCEIENDQAFMGNLNFKRCPKCSVWIQKSEGCNYIDCKCGCKFCYKCGNMFDRDPCRNGSIWKNDQQIRKKLRAIKIMQPKSPIQFLLFLPKLILQIFFSIILTILLSFVTLTIAFILFALISVFGPLGLLMLGSEFDGSKRKLFIGAIIIFYPVFIGLFALLLLIITFFYPFLRTTYHHGVYDPYDQGLSNISLCYISTLATIWSV